MSVVPLRGTPATLAEMAGYGTQNVEGTPTKPIHIPGGGVVVHLDELGPLYNLLEDNPEEWNHRLRVVVAGLLIHYIAQGKIVGGFDSIVSIRKP